MAVHGELIDAAALAALIAGNRQGLATYRWHGEDAELVSINALPPRAGIGTALIEALTTMLRAERVRGYGSPRRMPICPRCGFTYVVAFVSCGCDLVLSMRLVS